jgi:hypothetical protein
MQLPENISSYSIFRSLPGWAAILLIAGILAGCEDNFDPRASLQEQMVVFSVLSTDRPAQFVRVQRNYMPPEFDPLSYTGNNFLSDAIVTIRESNKVFRLRDTLLKRGDTSRYKFPMKTFYIDPLTPLHGRSYQVIIQSPSEGQINATATVPDKPLLTISPAALQILDRPDRSIQDARIVFVVQLSKAAKGYLPRLYLYYDVLKDNEWIEERAEIPTTSADSSSYSLNVPQYPKMMAAPNTSQVGVTYLNGYYKAIINTLNEKYKRTRLIFKWATVVILQADQNLFKYYAGAHGAEDPYSIRLDEPLFSTVQGGLGMVGAYSLDSLVNILPENFWGNR